MTACADTQQEEDSWSVIVKKCEDLAMSKKAGDTFAPNAQAQAPGNNTGLGKTRESVSFLVFKKRDLTGMPVPGSMGNVVTTIQQWLQVNMPLWHDKLARTNQWNTMWVFAGFLLAVVAIVGIGFLVVKGSKALWHSHVRKIEKRVNEKKKRDKQVDLEQVLQELNVSEEEKQKLKAKICIL